MFQLSQTLMRTKRLFPRSLWFLTHSDCTEFSPAKVIQVVLFNPVQDDKNTEGRHKMKNTRGLAQNGWGRTTTNPDMTLMCRSHHNQIILKIISVFFCTLKTLQLGSYLSYRIAFALNDWV